MTSTHFIIGDAHARPGVSNRRFSWLGQYILDYHLSHPEESITVIDMGDFEDMPSLSSYDVGKRCYEGRRYKADLAAAHDAREKLNKPISDYNKQRRQNKKSTFQPYKISLGGNHFEGRVERVTQMTPMLEGAISVSDNKCEYYGWKYISFKKPIVIDGISYVHYWQGTGTAKPMGMGKYPAATVLREKHCSSVTGHNHMKDKAELIDGQGNRIIAISAGCFFDPDQWEEYASQSNVAWWSGIIILKGVEDGYPKGGYEEVPIGVLQRRYG